MSGPELIEFTHGHLFCGLGGGAAGFNRGEARLGKREVRFRCAGGIDVDPGAITAFTARTGVPGTVLDLFSREQYTAFHGREPPSGWREATPADIRAAFGQQHIHCLFTSPPCKGLSGLLPERVSSSPRYQALNQLTVRGILLALEAYRDDPAEFLLLENVPRIQTRGRALLDQIIALLQAYGYATAETTHDCGELGGLAQTRRRFLLVARHIERVPPFLYEPQKKPLIAVGRLLEKFALPGDPAAGPMHRVPNLQWKTWVRLAFVEAGSDWRSLQKLRIENGYLADYALAADAHYHGGIYGVHGWNETVCTVTGEASPSAGAYSVADPRIEQSAAYAQLGVRQWDETTGAVSGQSTIGGGAYAIADPRMAHGPRGPHFNNVYRVIRWSGIGSTVTAGTGPSSGGNAIADPRPGLERHSGDHYATAGHYGVVPWDRTAYAVTGSARHDNGSHNVADPRLPAPTERIACIIRALDGTWHRPFTTLELAALQGLVEPDEHAALPGTSDSQHREWIGNAVPPPAAAAVAGAMGHALLLAMAGETFILSATPVWVRPIAVALSVARREVETP